jgi:CrcB protein
MGILRMAYIAGFGLVGVFARYYLGLAVPRFLTPPFPYATFLINVSGSFAIGIVYVLGAERAAIPPDLRIGLMVGLLGGFTTFSSYGLEALRLLEESQYWYAALYFGLSPVIGLFAAFLGASATRLLTRG